MPGSAERQRNVEQRLRIDVVVTLPIRSPLAVNARVSDTRTLVAHARMWTTQQWRALFLAGVLALTAIPVVGQPRELPALTAEDLRTLALEKRHEPKVTGPLRAVLPSPTGGSRDARARVPLALERDGLVPVTIYTSTPDDVLTLLTSLSRPTAHVIGDVIEVYVAPEEVPQLTALPSVLRLTLIEPGRPQSVTSYGVVVSQGRSVHNASNWIGGGYTGAGVKVGIIDYFGGISTAVAAGEIPMPVAQRCYTSVGSFSTSLTVCSADVTDHGTAVAESMMDIAPGALLYLASPMSSGDLKASVDWMIGQGVTVINLSAGYLWDGYGDGTSPFANSPLNTVTTAVSAGVVFVSAAGNQRLTSYLSSYRDPDADGWVDFTGTFGFESIALSRTAGQTIDVQLRWDGNWPGTSRDLDLYLTHSSGTLVATSLGTQDGTPGSVPWERLAYTVPVTGTYYLRVRKASGLAPNWIQLTDWNGRFGDADAEYTDAGGISNPAESASSGALTVGAAPHYNTLTIEPSSSRGPTPDGRIKPDLVGADRADTSVYGAGAFAGTSQAAPHVAGLAALIRDAFPSFTPQQVVAYLKTFAVGRGSVPNTTWGYGFARLPDLCAPTLSLASATLPAAGGTVSVGVTAGTGCVWSASTSAGWLSASPTTGSGNGTVTLTASVTASASVRTATATIAGHTVTVTQAAADRPVGLAVASISGHAVTLHWQWPGVAPDGYVLKGGVSRGHTMATLPIAGRAPAFTFLAPTGIFYVRVAGVRGGIELPPSDDVRIVVNVPETPSAPTQLLGMRKGSDLALSWTNTFDGGTATGLVLDVTGALATSLPLAVTEQFTFNGVPPGTYTFRVRATNAQGSSASSNAVTLSFPGACQVPAVPQALEAYLVGPVITLRWNAPATGAAVTRYVLTVDGAVSLALPLTGRSLSSAAPPGTYTFRVAAQNACGTGPSTSTRTVTVP